MKESGIFTVRIAEFAWQIFEPEDYAICLSKDNTELRDQINEALAELKADGTIDSIIANYIGDDTESQSSAESE